MENEKRFDLISRDRLLRDPYFQEDRYPESHLLRMAIREQPKVDAVEVVHGKWIEDRWTKWQCDKCHSPSPAYGYPRMEYVKTRYCPNCGAKMDGGNEDG